MQKKHTAWTGRMDLMDALSAEGREKQLLNLVYGLSLIHISEPTRH